MFLERAHSELGWPRRDEVLFPSGIGAKLIAQLAGEKLGRTISRRPDAEGVKIGVLVADPNATEAPIAIVCEFQKKVSEETLRETHKLAWNFSRTPLLITIEPHTIRKWTCCEPPVRAGQKTLFDNPEIGPHIDLNPEAGTFLSEQAAASLHWIELITGHFFQTHADRFRPECRADQMLLGNLREVRQRLIDAGLSDNISHDLLARIVFVQFLFDRKDTEGKAALSGEELYQLHAYEKVLSGEYRTLAEILSSYQDTYAFFRWLDKRFNGDLFPGKGDEKEREADWAAEQQQVTDDHLDLLARFVSGQERMKDSQQSLWPYYSFDAIPLEFISNIYEEFVKKDAGAGVHYTPAHLVDLILDSVLPWESDEWDLKVLDPACGSGVFLVKAFQRLVYRWKRAHPDQRATADVLTRLLEENLLGVDKDAHAIRVASFSLYLAMCDHIDPRDYWKDVHFPVLRGRRLIAEDFFSEDHEEFGTIAGGTYDLVIGNPPWGKNTITPPASEWQARRRGGWPISYGDIGPLFLAKSIALTKPQGCVALLQPASTLLYNRTSRAVQLREKLFGEVQVEEIINLAALRYVLFKDAIVPACVIVVRNSAPDGEPFWYSCPKPLHSREDEYRIVIEPQEIHLVYAHEVVATPWIWSTLMWGGRRDLAFINRLSQYLNLVTLEAQGIVITRQGIIRGKKDVKLCEAILRRPLLNAADFPADESLFVDALGLAVNSNPYIDARSSTDFRAFELPQLIIKQSWMENQGRFRAALVRSDSRAGGVICSDTYLTVHAGEGHHAVLEAACLSYNSLVAVYYLLLTSGRFAMDRNEAQAEALRTVPLPVPRLGLLKGVETVEGVDERAREAFEFKEAEWVLIEDLAEYTLPDYKRGSDSPGRQATHRQFHDGGGMVVEPELQRYCQTLQKVLQAGFGQSKHIGAVIFSEPTQRELPVRLISVYLNMPSVDGVQIETMQAPQLRESLSKLYGAMGGTDCKESSYLRCVRTYDAIQSSGQTGILVNMVKPDQARYWTRSMAMRDADDIAADFAIWSSESQTDSLGGLKVASG
jgi:N-6 DNA Methylase